MAEDDPEEVRREVYDKIVLCAKKGLADYYHDHPDRIGDERSKAAIETSTDGIRCVLAVLDNYVIIRKPSLPEVKT